MKVYRRFTSELFQRRPIALGATLATFVFHIFAGASPTVALAATLAVLAICTLLWESAAGEGAELVAAIAVGIASASLPMIRG
ncbi:MAG: hypothetical protein ABI346_09570 [Candidatus Baltobacteraceae bacterium]